MTIEDVAQQLASHIKRSPADYAEARVEESSATQITYRGRQLESVSKSSAAGGNVRALARGGWGFVSFNDFNGLSGRIDTAADQARYVGRGESKLADIPHISETVRSTDPNPSTTLLAIKKEMLDGYNELIWSTPGIQTSTISYGDSYRKTIFVNSEGSYIIQERADITLRVSAIAASNGDVQQAGFSIGSRGDLSQISNKQKEVKELANHAVELLSAPKVKGGEYTVVLDPVLAGVFVHEAFGHLSESDFVYENERMREIMVLGTQFGGKHLNIIDGAVMPGLRGSFAYDDEGTPATRTYLIREGKLVGRLHSRETAAKMGEQPTGNARAISYRYPPIVRMTNTYIEPGKTSFNDMIADIKEGIYARNWYGGMTSMEMFTFSSGEAYMLRNGRVAEAVRPVMLTGNVFTTLKNIDVIGNDLDMNQGGGCGKGEQMPLPVSNGSPHIRIQHCLVGGK